MTPFIVGVPRSGTTLLRMMLDSHPLIAIPPETGFLSRLTSLPWLWPGPIGRKRLHAIVTGTEAWPDFHLEADALAQALDGVSPFTLADGIRAFYRLYAARFDKPLWGDKTPIYGRHAAAIARLLPEARFIHIIRDGRDVALSLAPMWFAPSAQTDVLASYWMREIRATRQQASRLRHYLEVRYEDLIGDPQRELEIICRFLDVEFDTAMLRSHERAGTRLDEHEARPDSARPLTKVERRGQQWRTEQRPDPSRIGRWRHEMDATNLRAFESIAGDFLRELGYTPATR